MSDETNYGRLERELREAPATFIPALLSALVETAEKKRVFNEGGLLRFVRIRVDTQRLLAARAVPTEGDET